MNFSSGSDVDAFLRRCFDLARLGAGRVSPNPQVGAVLENEGRIIGEGYHRRHGGAHAEVEAVRSVHCEDHALISRSTLYVSLEPCCIHGRTPPCTNLILDRRIPRVVVSNRDQTPGVDGKGLQLLREGGVVVQEGLLEAEGAAFSRIRNCFVSKNRPYILLKFARSADGYLGQEGRQVWLTDAVTRRLVHKWRSEADAILIGAKTASVDDPELTNRLYFGKSPIRLVIDSKGSLPHSLRVFDGKADTRVFTGRPEAFEALADRVTAIKSPPGPDLLPFILAYLAEAKITSLLVEGGASLLGQLIEGGWWDEARVLEATVHLDQGIPAPLLPGPPSRIATVQNDRLFVWYNR